MDRRPAAGHPTPSPPRRGYLDWMRGLAVLIMIEAHLLDSWTGGPDRDSAAFSAAVILGGMGAPLFLFLAGLSVSLSAASKSRKSGDRRAGAAAVVRRGLEIFGLAFLFRLQAWVLGWGNPRTLLRVDILNIMGPSIMAAAALWGAFRTTRARLLAFSGAALAVSLATPLVRSSEWLAVLPDPLEAYLRPVPVYASFVIFPWAGLTFAGAVLGVAIDAVRSREEETRLNLRFFLAGAALALAAYAGSHLPTLYPSHSSFWTSSPSFFLLRVGLMTAMVGVAYAWEARPWRPARWTLVGPRDLSPLQQLGRTSLFIYWIHVELVYGLISLPLHKAMTLGQAIAALVAFALLMLGCSIAKDRFVERWQRRREPGAKRGA